MATQTLQFVRWVSDCQTHHEGPGVFDRLKQDLREEAARRIAELISDGSVWVVQFKDFRRYLYLHERQRVILLEVELTRIGAGTASYAPIPDPAPRPEHVEQPAAAEEPLTTDELARQLQNGKVYFTSEGGFTIEPSGN